MVGIGGLWVVVDPMSVVDDTVEVVVGMGGLMRTLPLRYFITPSPLQSSVWKAGENIVSHDKRN